MVTSAGKPLGKKKGTRNKVMCLHVTNYGSKKSEHLRATHEPKFIVSTAESSFHPRFKVEPRQRLYLEIRENSQIALRMTTHGVR